MSEHEQSFIPEVLDPSLSEGIEFLGELQEDYGTAVAELRRKYGITNRGCGPSAFGLAVLLQDQLDLPIDASMDREIDEGDGIHIVFGLMQEDRSIDHAWIEAVHGDQALIVSPDSSQHSADSSFNATIVETRDLDKIYPLFGLSRLGDNTRSRIQLTEHQWHAINRVLLEINSGEIPGRYADWVSTLLSQLRV